MRTNFGYRKAIAVTTSDSVNFAPNGVSDALTAELYVGTTGNVVAVLQDGTTITFVGVPAGGRIPVACKRVNATLTTASNIVAFFDL